MIKVEEQLALTFVNNIDESQQKANIDRGCQKRQQ